MMRVEGKSGRKVKAMAKAVQRPRSIVRRALSGVECCRRLTSRLYVMDQVQIYVKR